MYRDGIYRQSPKPDLEVDPYQTSHQRHVEDDSRSDVDPTFGRHRGSRTHHSTQLEKGQASQLGEDPHGYNIGQENFANLKQQLHELETENTSPHRYRHSPPGPISSQASFLPKDRQYSSPEHSPISQDYSSEFSSRDSSPKHHSPEHRSPSHRSPGRSPLSPKSKSRSLTTEAVQEGYREARHFAGGLIRHPSESTEDYSIVRHSHGLVFYQGTHTSVAISIFSNKPLPANRALLLKPKNWSITTKNRATFRRQTDALLNVTPKIDVKSEQVNPSDERAWQRDIHEFRSRNRSGSRKNHILRETDVVRIPAEAGDGYFQLLLCVGDKDEVLCISPVFRILSVSSNMGAISGANWATLPLEIGAIVMSIQARRYAGALFLPAKSAIKGKTSPYMPAHAGTAKTAGKLAYGATGASNMIGAQIESFNSKYHEERDGTFTPIWKIDDDYESGPKQPYPIRFTARSDVADEFSAERHILPMTKLKGVPDIVTFKLSGYYFGWCTIPTEGTDKPGRRRKREHWFQTIIIVKPRSLDSLDRITLSRVNKMEVELQILADGDELPQPNTPLKVEVFGCLRPWDQELERELAVDLEAAEEVAYETAFINEMSDITLTRTILDYPTWGPEAVTAKSEQDDIERLKQKKEKKGMERLKHEYTEKRLAIQRKIDQVPLHKVGVRMPVDKMRDKSVVMNGFFIER